MIPDRDTMLIHAVLESPAPLRRVTHYTISLGNLIDFNMRTSHPGASRVVGPRPLNEGLRLSAPAIAVLREEGRSIRCTGTTGDQGVTHDPKGIAHNA